MKRRIGAEEGRRRSPGWRTSMALVTMMLTLVLGSWISSSARAAGGARHSRASSGGNKLHAMLPASIKKSGTIVDVINLPYPPMEYSNPGSSKVIGFDIDMAAAVARKLGVKISYQNVKFEQIIPSVQTHRGDFAWTAVFDLKKRQKILNLIDYFKTGSQLFTSAANASKYKTVKSLCGQTVAVPTGTFFGQIVQHASDAQCKGRSPIQQVIVPSPTEQELQIKEGRAAAAISGVETVLFLMKQHPKQWALVGSGLEPDYYAVLIAKDNKKLLNAMFAAMKAAFKDGTYKRVLAKWGLSRAALKAPLINKGLH